MQVTLFPRHFFAPLIKEYPQLDGSLCLVHALSLSPSALMTLCRRSNLAGARLKSPIGGFWCVEIKRVSWVLRGHLNALINRGFSRH
jgi:hypothetical protein